MMSQWARKGIQKNSIQDISEHMVLVLDTNVTIGEVCLQRYATPFYKQNYNENDEKTQKGFQVYLQLAVGYRIEFFKKRFNMEPAYALKYWPIDTNVPEDFALIEDGAPNYIFEPSLNFGFKF